MSTSSDENRPPSATPSPLPLAPLLLPGAPFRELPPLEHAQLAPTPARKYYVPTAAPASETPRRPLGALTNSYAPHTAPARARPAHKLSSPRSIGRAGPALGPHAHAHAHAHATPGLPGAKRRALGPAPGAVQQYPRHPDDLPSIRQMGLAGVGARAPYAPFTPAHSPSPYARPLALPPSTPTPRAFSPAATPFAAHHGGAPTHLASLPHAHAAPHASSTPGPAPPPHAGERRAVDLRGLHGPAVWAGAYPYDFSAKRPPPPEPGKAGRATKDGAAGGAGATASATGSKKKQSAAPSINPWDYVVAHVDAQGRRRFPRHEIDVMELMWSDQMSPCKWTRMRMARWFGCRTHHVTVWNRRQELKKAQNGAAQAEETLADMSKTTQEKAAAQAELDKCRRQIDAFGAAHTRVDDWEARRDAVFTITSMDQPDFDWLNAADVAATSVTPSPPQPTGTGAGGSGGSRAKRPRQAITMDDVCNDREQSMMRQAPAPARALAPLPLRSLRDMDAADPAYASTLLGKMSSDLPSEPAEPDAAHEDDDDKTDATDAGTDAGTEAGGADADAADAGAAGADGSPRRRTKPRLPPCSEIVPRSRLPGIHVPKSKFGRTSSADLFWHSTRARQLYGSVGGGSGSGSGSARAASNPTPFSASSSTSSLASTGPLRAVSASYASHAPAPATPGCPPAQHYAAPATPALTPAAPAPARSAAAALTPRAIPPATGRLNYLPTIQHRDSFSRSQSGPADLAGPPSPPLRALRRRWSPSPSPSPSVKDEPDADAHLAHPAGPGGHGGDCGPHTSSDAGEVLQTPAHVLAGARRAGAGARAASSPASASSDLARTPPDMLHVRGKFPAHHASVLPAASPADGSAAGGGKRALLPGEGRTIYTPKEDDQDLAAAEALMGMVGKNMV